MSNFKIVDTYLRKILFVIFSIITLIGIIAPIWQSLFGYPNGEKIYSFLHNICHQYPTRSLWIAKRPCALCSRCMAGYTGIAIASLFIWLPRKYFNRLLIGFILIIPGIADGIIQLSTDYESSNLLRIITGFVGGIGIFILLYPLSFNFGNNVKGDSLKEKL
ncbi:MAG: DUF2085 domain-containing protein [Deltaproteobacteria bacterium]|nr:DUF2085 domain-containing protein [Deltaproteobacteria bacterium]